MATPPGNKLHVYDARAIFDTAEVFHTSAERLFRAFVQESIQIIPASLTCYAFSLELYLKSLITIEKGGFPSKGAHDLQAFFTDLSQDAQDKIRSIATQFGTKRAIQFQEGAKKMGAPTPPDFDYDTALTASKRGFVNWRYVYENNFKPDEGWQGGEIIFAVRAVILEHHPDWGSAWQYPP